MIHREDAEQKALIQWADVTPMPAGLALYPGAKVGDYLFAIPNGGARGRTEAARLVGLGVRAGVCDLFFSFPSSVLSENWHVRHGLYIEMKAPKPYGKKAPAKQLAFIERMQGAGYGAVVCYGWDAAIQAISDHLSVSISGEVLG